MEHHKIASIYGYAVCIVAVITFLIAVANIVGPILDIRNPLPAAYRSHDRSLASFETYKMDTLRQLEAEQVPDDAVLRAAYQAAREERISAVRHRAVNQLAGSIIAVLAALLLFVFHWVWLSRLRQDRAV